MKDVLEHLSKQLQADRLRSIEDMGDGKAKDHSEYKYSCGVVRGLLIANNHIIELAERLEKAND